MKKYQKGKRVLTVFEKEKDDVVTLVLSYPSRFEIFTITKWLMRLLGYHITYEYYENGVEL